jgi:transcriptional regulator with XRE-family HTH domain
VPTHGLERTRRPFPADLGVALRAARERLGLTRSVTAQLIGVSPNYLGSLERARKCPSVAVAEDLVRVLHLPSGVASWLTAVAAPDTGRSHPNKPAKENLAAEVGEEITRMILEAQALPTAQAGRQLEREHGWRTLKAGREIEARPSRADEQRFADEAAAKGEIMRQELEARRQAEQAERDEELRRAVLHALRALDRVHELTEGDRGPTVRAVRHHARRLAAHLDALNERDH